MRAYGEIAPKAVFPGNQSNERATQAGLCFEMAMPPDYRPGFAQSTDLRMMLLFGRGRIRTAGAAQVIRCCGSKGQSRAFITAIAQANCRGTN